MIQPPETNAQYLGWGPSLLGAEFVRGQDVPESSTEQFVDTFFETTHRQNMDNLSTLYETTR